MGGMDGMSAGTDLGDKLHKNYNETISNYYNEKLQHEQQLLDQRKLDEQKRQFDLSQITTRDLTGRNQNQTGIQMLANARTQAQQQANLSGFRNGLVNLYS
jgi:hypothetical protein